MNPPLSRGDVVLTPFPFTNLQGQAVRPAIIVSPGAIADDVVLLAVSSVIRGTQVATDYILEVNHPEFSLTGLRVRSVLRAHKLFTLEQTVLVRRLGKLGPLLLAEIDRLLRLVLSL